MSVWRLLVEPRKMYFVGINFYKKKRKNPLKTEKKRKKLERK